MRPWVSMAIIKVPTSRLTVLIKVAEGKVLHWETIGKGKESYKRNFNLWEMGDGTYCFELNADDETITKKVSLFKFTTRIVAVN